MTGEEKTLKQIDSLLDLANTMRERRDRMVSFGSYHYLLEAELLSLTISRVYQEADQLVAQLPKER